MRVLVLHNAYQQQGGEDAVVHAESTLLERHGNLAAVHIVSNDRIAGWSDRLKAALGVVFSFSGYSLARKQIRTHRPDVVHVHNFFPLLSPSILYACRAAGVPVVMTLHNYRIVCPTALLMHEGVVTERSLRDGPWWAVPQRVYRGSLAGTFLLCLMISVHRRIGTWKGLVDRYIVLSNFAYERFRLGGLPGPSMVVKPNFVDVDLTAGEAEAGERAGLLFVGRLSPEKGIDVLLAAARTLAADKACVAGSIQVAGDGPLREEVARSAVTYLGSLPAPEVRRRMLAASALVLPSIWYEGFPMVLVEAYASGLPVIASRIGALAELVEDGVTGLHFNPGDEQDLRAKMQWALEHPAEMRLMGQAARQRYLSSYTAETNYLQLMGIYRDAVSRNDEKQRRE